MIPFHILGRPQSVLIRLAPLLVLLVAGCVSTGFDFTTTEDLEAAHDVLDPATGKTTHYAPRQRVTHRTGRYMNNQALGQAAGGMMQDFGGIGGILTAISPGGWAGIGAGVLGLLGIAHRQTVKAADLSGQNKGYTQAQLELAANKDLNNDGVIGTPTGAST